MRPERASESNIPDGGISVNRLIADAVSACPVRLCRVGLQVRADATDEQLMLAVRNLFKLSARVNIFVYYSLGDVVSHLPPRSARRNAFVEMVKREVGESYAVRLTEFGKIARRWPHDRRNEDLPWAYYRTHKPGKPGQPDVKIEPKDLPLTDRSVTIEDGLEIVRYKGPSGRVFVYRGEVKP